MIVGDPDSENGILQVEITYPYAKTDERPIVIVRKKNNPILFETFKKQYHEIANRGVPPEKAKQQKQLNGTQRGLKLQHEANNPEYYWESAMFRGESMPLDRILKEDEDEEGYRYIRRVCNVKVINNSEQTIKDVVVKLESFEPKADQITLPMQLRFSGDTRLSIDLHPLEARFVNVIYWEFPRGRVSKDEWDLQYYICGIKKDIRIKQLDYQLRIVAYGLNARAEIALSVGKPPENTMHKEIWIHT
jgi:hypothetical protein